MKTKKPHTVPCNCLLFFLLCFPGALASTVQAQGEDDVVRVDTDLVILNVTVTDKSGQYVPGLSQADFKIFENGKEVPQSAIVSFDMQDTPFASVVLLDTSGSMDTRMSMARSAAIRFLDGLRDEDVAAVFKFDTKIEQLQDFSPSHDLAPLAFGLHADGMTTLNDAIVKAANLLADRPEKRRAIVVLSDGIDTYSKASAGKALDTAMAVGATIYAVDMSMLDGPAARNQQTAMMLRSLTEKSGGRFVATPGGPALRDAFANIAEELGHQYTIAYRPLETKKDGKWRTLDVKLPQPGLELRTRKGYRPRKS
jgi:Ca-activated chloride channel homolog